MNYSNNKESNSEKLRKIQAELDDLYSKGKLNVEYKVLAIDMVPKKGTIVKLKCLLCDMVKERKLAHIRNRPDKGGCICKRKHTEKKILKKLQKVLGDDYVVKMVFRKQTTSDEAKYTKKPFHAHIYDKKWRCTHRDVNVNNIFSKGTLPMTFKRIHDKEVSSSVESLWQSLKVKFVARPQRLLKKGGKKPYCQSMIFPFVRCTNCGEEYFKRFSRSKKTTRTFCCGLGGTTGKREDFIKRCKRNEGKGLLYFCYLRHPLGFEYIKHKAGLIVTADDKTRPYGSFNPDLTKTYMGFVYDETEEDLTEVPIVYTPALSTSPPGTYPIELYGGAADNYEISLINGVLTIEDALGLLNNEALITVYPNPAADYFTLSDFNSELDELKIYDSKGALVHMYDQKQDKYNVAHLNKGVFLIMIKAGDGNYIHRLIKK
ncbi:MBG domain-containing protein [Ekhidna sp.]|uniref:MBG domain-containing protein n=1 Tax=Ekhidna sp. TaxID=2608089 RepID=UPI003B5BBC97